MNRIRARWWMNARWQDKLTESNVFLDDVWKWRVIVIAWCEEGRVFQTLGAETWKAREPNDSMWHGTKSSWDEDECVDFGVVRNCYSV